MSTACKAVEATNPLIERLPPKPGPIVTAAGFELKAGPRVLAGSFGFVL